MAVLTVNSFTAKIFLMVLCPLLTQRVTLFVSHIIPRAALIAFGKPLAVIGHITVVFYMLNLFINTQIDLDSQFSDFFIFSGRNPFFSFEQLNEIA